MFIISTAVPFDAADDDGAAALALALALREVDAAHRRSPRLNLITKS
jgi:hypothetical protein